MDEASVRRVLSELGSRKLKTTNSGVMGTCPFAPWTHAGGKDDKPSFSMKVDPGGESVWKCFTCGKKGTAKGLIYQMSEGGGGFRSDLLEIIRADQDRSTWKRFKKIGAWDDKKPEGPKKGEFWTVHGYEGKFDFADYESWTAEVPKYALNRGLTLDQIQKWKLGFDKKGSRLFIPVFDETGKMVGFSGRSIYSWQEPKYLHAEYMRRDKYLYGENLVNREIRVGHVSEGFMDVYSMDRFGLSNPLAVMGVACSPLHVEKLRKWFDKIVIFPHNDKPNPKGEVPGMKMATDYAEALRSCGVRVQLAPVVPEKKDIGDWTREDFDWAMSILMKQEEAASG